MGVSGISSSFLGLFRSSGQVPHVLLTRSPLTHVTRRSSAFDLHVLGPPPAFVLSQDQTLRQNLGHTPPKRRLPSNQWCDATRGRRRREFEVARDTNPGRPGTGQWWSAGAGHRCPSVHIEIVQGLPRDDSRSSLDSPHWLFRPLFRFQGAPGGRRPPGTRLHWGGGGALRSHRRFDPEPDLPSGRPPTLRLDDRLVKRRWAGKH